MTLVCNLFIEWPS